MSKETTYKDFTIESLLAHKETAEPNVRLQNHLLIHVSGEEWGCMKSRLLKFLKKLSKDLKKEIKLLEKELEKNIGEN